MQNKIWRLNLTIQCVGIKIAFSLDFQNYYTQAAKIVYGCEGLKNKCDCVRKSFGDWLVRPFEMKTGEVSISPWHSAGARLQYDDIQ